MNPVDTASLAEVDLHHWRACERRFWLTRRTPGLSPTDASPAGAHPALPESEGVRGPALDDALRAHWPLARWVQTPRHPDDWAAALAQTQKLLQDLPAAVRADASGYAPAPPEGWAVLGACVQSESGLQARIDVMTPSERGLKLYKLRWATAATEADVDAVAWSAEVARRAGWPVTHVGLLLVDNSFVYPGHGCYAGLLKTLDLGPIMSTRPIAEWVGEMRLSLSGPKPGVPLGAPCTAQGGCPLLQSCGLPPDPGRLDDPRVALEVLGAEPAALWRAAGARSLRDVPPQKLDVPRLRRAAMAVQTGRPVLEPEAAEVLRSFVGPRRWLRFETIGFAVPVWSETQPYQVLPFQWSCDAEDACGMVRHQGFLARAQGGDPRRAFAESLLEAMGDSGPVFAYNAGFERNRLRELSNRFSDLSPGLDALLARVVDLFQILRAHYYHPSMAGSWSARSVFQAIAPDLKADVFNAPEPGCETPLLAYAASMQRGLADHRVQALRDALTAHGHRQTAALRRITALLDEADRVG